jgi:hypothetical protein
LKGFVLNLTLNVEKQSFEAEDYLYNSLSKLSITQSGISLVIEALIS